MNLFSLIFALLLALAFMVFLLLFLEAEKRRMPAPAPDAPVRAAALLAGAHLVSARMPPFPSFIVYNHSNVPA